MNFLMYRLIFSILSFLLVGLVYADEFDIKTSTNKNGQTIFYLQSGIYNHKNKADEQQKILKTRLDQPVLIVPLDNQTRYIIKIGPINDYQTATTLKKTLSTDAYISNRQRIKSNTPSALKQSPRQLWNLRNADIRAVIAEISKVTGKNFLIDPRVQGKISIISSTPISTKELYQVFLSMLQVSGYAAIDSGDVTKIIPNIDAKTQASDLLSQMKSPPTGEEMVVEVVPVKYVPAEQLVPVLRPLMPQWDHVSAYSPSNMLILSGRAGNIRRLSHIIKQVDSSSANGIDVLPLKHALAMDVANTLKDLVKTQPGSGLRTPTMVAADDRSNAILLSGNRTERIRLRLLISRLDKESRHGMNNNTQVIYLNYLRAEDIVPILAGVAQANFSGNVGTTMGTITRPALDSTNPASNMASGTSSSDKDADTTGAQAQTAGDPGATAMTTGTSTQTEGSTKPTVQIIGEPNTNSIIINAPVSIIQILRSVITQLDIRPAQLLIEALVAEVDQRDLNDLGIEWGYDALNSGFRPGFAIINSRTKLDYFQAQIYALARQRKANILSTPSIVVLDNRQAKILVGRQVSIATTTYPGNANGTAIANPYTTFDRVNVALHLYVRPQITRGQGIQLQIDQGNDTLDPSSGTTVDNQPIFKISSIVTSVHVESGDVVILGGLSQDSLANDDNRLPILGDIPGIGKLFQRNLLNREKKVLMVFIKPLILRNPRDAVNVTTGKYRDLRQEQLEFVRTQDYHPENDDSVLPPLKEATLPRPFCHPDKQPVVVQKSQVMTK